MHGSDEALANHTTRSEELEQEYLRRHPARDVDPSGYGRVLGDARSGMPCDLGRATGPAAEG